MIWREGIAARPKISVYESCESAWYLYCIICVAKKIRTTDVEPITAILMRRLWNASQSELDHVAKLVSRNSQL
jgi:hypothetical protein